MNANNHQLYVPKGASDLSLPAGEVNFLEDLFFAVLGSEFILLFVLNHVTTSTVDRVGELTASVFSVIICFFVDHRLLIIIYNSIFSLIYTSYRRKGGFHIRKGGFIYYC